MTSLSITNHTNNTNSRAYLSYFNHTKQLFIQRHTKAKNNFKFEVNNKSKFKNSTFQNLPSFSDMELTLKQKEYYNYLRNDNTTLVVGTGPPGTGKTLLACYIGVEKLLEQKHSKMIITRPCVSIEREMGYLPGDIDNKMDPWLKPIYDSIDISYNSKNVSSNALSGKLEIAPLSFIRGRTFSNAYIIADEMQNASIHEVKSLLTRIGDNCKIIFTGDPSQCDLEQYVQMNGLNDLINKIDESCLNEELNNVIKKIEFSNDDIKRSEFTRLIMELYN